MERTQRLAIRLMLFLVLSVSFSCSFVKSPVPFGLKPVKVSADHYAGVWVNDDEDGDTFEIKVLNAEKGLLEIHFDDGDSSKLKKLNIHLMAGNKWQYASVPAADDGSETEGFLFVCILSKPDRTVIWMPDVSKFAALIESGKLSGKIEKKNVILDEVTPGVIAVVESEKYGTVFDWREPMILRKKRAE